MFKFIIATFDMFRGKMEIKVVEAVTAFEALQKAFPDQPAKTEEDLLEDLFDQDLPTGVMRLV
jgi:hypothetical protein